MRRGGRPHRRSARAARRGPHPNKPRWWSIPVAARYGRCGRRFRRDSRRAGVLSFLRSWCWTSSRSHAEYAELGGAARLLARDGEREAERAARVDGVEHAVVPEPRRGVKRMALPFELLANRGFDLLL